MTSASGFVESVLKSPLHRLMSGKLLLLRYVGERTSAEFTLPLKYAATQHGIVVMVTNADTTTWWRNFRSMGQAQVLLAGTWVPMTAHALLGSEDPEAVTPLLRVYAARFPKVVKTLEGANLEQRVNRAVLVWLRPAR